MEFPPGRADELDAMFRSLDRTAAGEPRVVLVSAAAALGRSELLDTFVTHSRAAGATVRHARGSDELRDVPYAIIDRIGVLAGEPDSAQAAAAALHSQLCGAAGDGVAVVCIDDLHLADRESWRVVMHLAHLTTYQPLMLVASMDSGVAPAYPRLLSTIAGHQGFVPLTLTPLGEHDVAQVLAENFPVADADRLAPAFADVTGGNPLLVRALLDDVPDPGALLVEPGEAFLCAMVAISMRWDVTTSATADALAVLGDTVTSVDLAALLGLPADDVSEALRDLRAIGLIDDSSTLRRSVRPTLLWSITDERRRELERLAAVQQRATTAGRRPATSQEGVLSAERAEALLSKTALTADTLPDIVVAIDALGQAGRQSAMHQWRQVFLVEARAQRDTRAEEALAAIAVEESTATNVSVDAAPQPVHAAASR